MGKLECRHILASIGSRRLAPCDAPKLTLSAINVTPIPPRCALETPAYMIRIQFNLRDCRNLGRLAALSNIQPSEFLLNSGLTSSNIKRPLG